MAEETSVAENNGGGGRLLIVIILFQMLAIAGLAYFVFTIKQDMGLLQASRQAQNEAESEFNEENETLAAEEKEPKSMGPMVKLGQLIVNLRGLDNRNHVLRTSLDIEVDTEETRREVESKITIIRYKLLSLLQNRRPQEVLGQNQVEMLRENMKRIADAVLKSEAKVVNIWPTSWIME